MMHKREKRLDVEIALSDFLLGDQFNTYLVRVTDPPSGRLSLLKALQISSVDKRKGEKDKTPFHLGLLDVLMNFFH